MIKGKRKYGRNYNDRIKPDNLVLVGDSHLVWQFPFGGIPGLPYLLPVLVHTEEIKYGNN
jgi:hypothetical protein